jgi:protein-S-isoprenylcysteine O-methyltransferase Ste14
MDIKLKLIFAFTILYGLFELYMGISNRKGRSIEKSGDRLSIWMLTIGISVGYWLSFMIGSTHIGRIYHWNTFFIIGSVIEVMGLVIRVRAITTLKQHFTYTVTKIENHELIEKGLYKYIRHPGYLGQLIIFLGISLTISNWLSVIGMIVPVFIGYLYRINTEEKFMVKQMGEKYIEYQKRTNRLIPLIY